MLYTRAFARAASVVAAFLVSGFAFAANSTLDSAFVSTISPGLTPTSYPTFDSGTGAVNAVALQSDGKIIAGGNVSRYQTSGDLTALKRLLPTGALDSSFNSGGAGLAASSGQPEVNVLLRVAGDKLYVGGTFSSYNSVARSGILRLNADGSLDTDFAPSGLGGTLRYALAIAEQADGKVLVGGAFTTINGTARANLARLNTDGSLDPGFNAATALAGSTVIADIAVLPNGQLIVAGGRTAPAGGIMPLLVRLNADGSLDSSLSPAFDAINIGDIDELVVLPDGRILIGGDFSFPGAAYRFACLRADGSLDTAFMANVGTGPDGWAGGEIALQPDGTILVGGIFENWNGQPRASIARLNQDGTLEATLAPAPYAPHGSYLTHFYSFAAQPDGKLVAGGWFSRVSDPAVETYNLTRFVNDYSAGSAGAIRLLSTAATTAENAGSVTLQVSRFGGVSGAVSVQYATSTGGANGTATAGSDYTTTSGTLSWADGEGGFKTITVPILQDASAEAAETFTVTLSNATGGATLPAASAKTLVTIRDDDSAPAILKQPASVTLEQGGNFTLSLAYESVLPVTIQWQRDPDGAGPLGFSDIVGANGTSYSVTTADPSSHAGTYRAVLTSTAGATNSGSAIVSISVPAGSVVTSFVPPTLSEAVVATALDSNGRFLVASQQGLRRYTSAGASDSSFTNSTFASLPVSALYLQADGKILVGGFFTTVNSTSRPALARFSADGVLDTSYTPSLPTAASGTLYAQTIAPGSGGKYYVGFGAGGGLRRYNADGTHDTGFVASVGGNLQGAVYAVRERSDGRVLVAHSVGANGFGFTYNLTLLESNGSVASSTLFTPPTLAGGPITTLELLPDERVAVGGRFTSINSVGLVRLAILNADGSVDTSFRAPTGLGPDGFVQQILYRNGRLLVVGEFLNIGGQSIRGVARVNLDGSLDGSFSIGAGADGFVYSALYTGSGDIFIGGAFTAVKSVSRQRVALLVGNSQIDAVGFAPAGVKVVESGSTVTLTARRYGSGTEAVSIAYATADAASGLGDTSAVAGADYVAASGTLAWGAGDTADKTISIQLINDATVETTKTFRVVLSNPSGPVSAAAPATVQILDDDTPASFTAQPVAPSTLTAGGSLSLSATVTSPTPVAYQWFLNGVAIPGATSASYAKNSITLADGGLYTLVATNAAGSFTSTAVLVVVQPLAGRVASGQATSGRPAFNSNPQAIVPLSDGGALVGGFFTNVNSSGINYLVRIKPDGSLDTSFNLQLNNTVAALFLQPDGKILVGGSFTLAGATSAVRLLRLNADATLTLDTAFSTKVGSTLSVGVVDDIVRDSTGRIYAGVDNRPSSTYVYRFAADGTYDSAYLPVANQAVLALGMQNDDKLLVAGYFTTLAGSSVSRLGRLNTDGSLDTGFTTGLGGSANVNDLLVLKDGRLFAAGSNFANSATLAQLSDTGAFASNVGSGNQVYELSQAPDGRITVVRTSSSGSGSVYRLKGTNPLPVPGSSDVDSTFDVGTGPNADVTTVTHSADGSIWIAGAFTTFNSFASGGVVKLQGSPTNPGIVNPPARTDVNAGATARLAVGAVGTNLTYQWLKNGSPLSDGGRISGATTAILVITGLQVADDDVYSVQVTGGSPTNTVTSAAVKLNVLGAPVVAASPASATPALGSTLTLAADVLAATPATYVWKRDGVVISNGGRYSGATTGTLVITGANNADNGVYTLTVTNGQGSVSTTPATIAVAQVSAARDTTLSALGATSAGSTSNVIRAVLHLPDGRTLLGGGGSFRGVGNTTVSSNLYLVDASGNLSATPAGNFNGEVYAIQPVSGGKILVAGSFTQVGSTTRGRIARLNADLTLDTGFAPVGAGNLVSRMVVDTQGRIYLYGSFFNYEGQSGYSNFVRLLPDGSLDLDYKVSFSGSVSALVALPDGKLLVGGGIGSHTFNDVSTNVSRLCRLLPTGAIDSTFTSAIPDTYSLDALAVDSGGRLLVGANSYTTQANYHLLRLLADGALDSGFTFSETINQQILALTPLPNGQTLVGGSFTTPTARLFRVNANGSRDTGFNVGTGFTHTFGSPAVNVIAPDRLGRLWVGGTVFGSYNGVTANSLAVLQGDGPALAFTLQPCGQTVDLGTASVQFSAAATGNNGFVFQWLKNGTPLADGGRVSGTATGTLTLANIAASDAANYSVRVTSGSTSIVSANATLTILAEPVIKKDPVAATIVYGGSATFSGAATGAATLVYQWLQGSTPLTNGTVDGVTIAGATTNTLTITGATFSQAGEYRLRVTNPHGTATTAAALLTVEKRPGALASGFLQPTANGEVFSILRLSDNSMLVGGAFTSVTVNSVTSSRSRLARFFSNGTLDPSFTPSIGGTVRAIAQDSSGRVFIGGDFTGNITIGGVTAARTRVARLTSGLVLDTAFDTSAAGPTGQVSALAPANDGSVYVGGKFTAVGAVTSGVNRMAKLAATGALDAAGFTSYASNDVNSILRLSDGTLYVGGISNTWNTPALPGFPASRLVKLNATGSSRDTNFTSPDLTTIVYNIIRLADGSLLVAANSGYLRRLDAATGATLDNYSTGHFLNVGGLAQQSDGKVLSGSYGTFKRTNLATDTDDTGFYSFDAYINAIALDTSGRIWVGGAFSTYNSVAQGRLAVLAGGEYESRNGLRTPQTIDFTAIADRTYNPAANTVTLAATASSGLAVTFGVTSGPATVSGNTLTITGAGNITIEAAQAGDSTYAPATATRSFAVAKAAQTISFAALADKTVASPAFDLSATASSGLAVSFEVSGPATLSGNTVTLTGETGTVTVTASQTGSGNYNAAESVTRSFAVTLGTAQTITFNALANRVATSAPFALAATASSGLAVSFEIVSGPATLGVDGKTVTLTGNAGTVTIRATQAGGVRNSVTYAPAAPVERSFEVTLGPPTLAQTITFNAPLTLTYGATPLALSANSSSGLPVTLAITASTPAGIASLDGNTLTITGAGKISVTATQAGAYPYKPATAVVRSITINKAPLAVTFASVSRLVGQPNPASFPPLYSGFVNDDTESDLAATRPIGKTTATITSAQGRYPITVSGGLDANYTFVAGAPAYLTVVGFGGVYEALLRDTDDTPRALLVLNVPTNTLACSGTLTLVSEATAVSLKVTLQGTQDSVAGTVTRVATTTLPKLDLSLSVDADGLHAELDRDGAAYLSGDGTPVFVQQLSGKTKLPAPWTGLHTLVLREPAPIDEADTRALPLGASQASASIATTGIMTLKGKLADGTLLTATARPAALVEGDTDKTGLYRLFVRPYSQRLNSFLAGDLTLVPHPDQTRFAGRYYMPAEADAVSWVKTALSTDLSYRLGFAARLTAFVDPWLAPSTTATATVPAGTLVQRLRNAGNATSSATVAVDYTLADGQTFGARAASFPLELTLSSAGAFTVLSPLPNVTGFTLTPTATTGAFTGSFTLRDTAPGASTPTDRKVTFSGTLRQGVDAGDTAVGYGQFLFDPVVGDVSTEQVSGELILSLPTP